MLYKIMWLISSGLISNLRVYNVRKVSVLNLNPTKGCKSRKFRTLKGKTKYSVQFGRSVEFTRTQPLYCLLY